MPFMIGKAPIRRTTEYLKAGKVIFRETVKIFSMNLSESLSHSEGAKDFAFWHLCQIQYKNPKVQCQTFRNLSPTPFIRIYFEDAKSVLMDLEGRTKEEILDHLVNFTAVCKSEKELQDDQNLLNQSTNPAYFGYSCQRHCMCEVFGQVPCSRIVTLPRSWRGRGGNMKLVKTKFRVPPRYTIPGLDNEDPEEE